MTIQRNIERTLTGANRIAGLFSCALVFLIWLTMPGLLNALCFCQNDDQVATRADDDAASQAESELSLDEIMNLISELDSRKFVEREQATEKLSRLGNDALRPMAFHFLRSSPESAWRIRKSLETIGTSGNEETFLKSAALLQLLFGDSGSEFQHQIRVLKMRWNAKRKVDAIEILENAGAEVVDPEADRNLANLGVEEAILQAQLELGFIEPEEDAVSVPARRRLTFTEQCREIETILAGSIEDNRLRVLEEPPEMSLEQQRVEVDRFDREIRIINGRAVVQMPGFEPVRGGVIVRLGENFSGGNEVIRQLKNISTLSSLELTGIRIDQTLLQILADLPLDSIKLTGCPISGTAVKQVGWPSGVTSMAFKDQTIDTFLSNQIAASERINSLSFKDCEIEDSSLSRIIGMDSLSWLQLGGMNLNSSIFSELEDSGIAVLSLAGCKFEQADYKRLSRGRPNMRINFDPRAFLGVRSQINGIGCRISEVIEGTGAADAGIRVNDVIETVEGESIEVFDDLRSHIATHEAGDTLAMTILRDGVRVNIKVVLSSIDDAPER